MNLKEFKKNKELDVPCHVVNSFLKEFKGL